MADMDAYYAAEKSKRMARYAGMDRESLITSRYGDINSFRTIDAADRLDDRPNVGKIILGRYSFDNKNEARKFVREVMQAVLRDGWLPDYRDFLDAVVSKSPVYHERVGAHRYGVVELHVQTNLQLLVRIKEPQSRTNSAGQSYHRQLCSFVVSLRDCLEMGSHRSRAVAAARNIVMRWYGGDRRYVCGICQTAIEVGDIHWDHFPHAFIDIFDEWRAHKRLLCRDIELSTANCLRFRDEVLCSEWQSFHDHFASFRPTHQGCNLRDKEREPFRVDAIPELDVLKHYQDWRNNSDRETAIEY